MNGTLVTRVVWNEGIFWLLVPGSERAPSVSAIGPHDYGDDVVHTLVGPRRCVEQEGSPAGRLRFHYEGLVLGALEAVGAGPARLEERDWSAFFDLLDHERIAGQERPEDPSLLPIADLWRRYRAADRALGWVIETSPRLFLNRSGGWRDVKDEESALPLARRVTEVLARETRRPPAP